jgi:hypothetical protein
MIVDGHAELEILYECWLSILANVSPFVKAVSMVTSNKLMHLFKLLSRPRFLFANERNHRYIFFLLNVRSSFPAFPSLRVQRAIGPCAEFLILLLFCTGIQQLHPVPVRGQLPADLRHDPLPRGILEPRPHRSLLSSAQASRHR